MANSIQAIPPSCNLLRMAGMQWSTNATQSICDIQDKFRGAIWEYPKSAGSALNIPVYATTQNSARLGPLCHELFPPSTPRPHFESDKTAFSMLIPSLREALVAASPNPYQIALVGIESHICVTQTALDLLAEGHQVYVLTDGVSSCNQHERTVALRRLAREGVIVTTSESWLYECMGDAGISEFKAVAGLVKETKESTRDAVETLCKM
ncbi:MAG: hypothetical protein Q9190_005124 [Brigantiaea leucoxantha]